MVSMSEENTVHKRRVRYKGRNPRRFEERYKEHNPEKYASEIEHIKAKGNTPAGSHRPIMVEEIVAALRPAPGKICLDVTLGYGGHAGELLRRISPGGHLFGIDTDPIEMPRTVERLRAQGFGEELFTPRPMNFAAVRGLLHETDGGFDAVLADLGVSSMQIDNPARGFTFKADGPLDLRLNPQKGQPAAALLQKLSEEKLAAILRDYADEPQAELLAQAIKRRLPLSTTSALAHAVREAFSGVKPRPAEAVVKKALQRTFMALRIATNDEFGVLDRFLGVLPWCLKPGGRVAVLSFHSGEDRRVKKAFSLGLQSGIYSQIAASPETPTPQECRANPRASCAKLRWAVRSELELEG